MLKNTDNRGTRLIYQTCLKLYITQPGWNWRFASKCRHARELPVSGERPGRGRGISDLAQSLQGFGPGYVDGQV